MKNSLRLPGIMTLVILIGLGIAACGDKTTGSILNLQDDRPELSGTVTIDGVPEVGETLTAYYECGGDETESGMGIAVWSWYRGDTRISIGSDEHTVVEEDMENTLKAEVLFSNYKGSKSSVIYIPDPTLDLIAINIAAIQGVTYPAAGAAPVTTVTENAQFTGTVSWSPSVSGGFAPNTIYTATITLTPKAGFTTLGIPQNFFTVAGTISRSNPADSGVVTALFPATASTINIAAIPGVTPPVAGAVPVTTITETAQYTGTVSWSPSVIANFAPGTTYTATITLTPKEDRTLFGITANYFTVAGSTSRSNPANSGVVTAQFPATASTINIAAIPGVTPPVAGAVPVTTITETTQYTGTVSWSPSVSGNFVMGTIYTATITLTPKTGFTLLGIAANYFTVAGSTSRSNPVNSGVVTAQFPATSDTITVAFNDLQAPGDSTWTTNQITLHFDKNIQDLTADNITLSGIPGLTKGEFNGSDGSYRLFFTGLTTSGTLTVAVQKEGYTITPSSRTVDVNYAGAYWSVERLNGVWEGGGTTGRRITLASDGTFEIEELYAGTWTIGNGAQIQLTTTLSASNTLGIIRWRLLPIPRNDIINYTISGDTWAPIYSTIRQVMGGSYNKFFTGSWSNGTRTITFAPNGSYVIDSLCRGTYTIGALGQMHFTTTHVYIMSQWAMLNPSQNDTVDFTLVSRNSWTATASTLSQMVGLTFIR